MLNGMPKGRQLLLHTKILIDRKKPSTTTPDISLDCQIYILVSGMSTLPVTVRFE